MALAYLDWFSGRRFGDYLDLILFDGFIGFSLLGRTDLVVFERRVGWRRTERIWLYIHVTVFRSVEIIIAIFKYHLNLPSKYSVIIAVMDV